MSATKSRAAKPASTRPEDEKLPVGTAFAFGLQHVLTMYGGIIAPPLIIGSAAGIPATQLGVLIAACLFMGGLATLLQTLGIPFFGSQLPLVQGVSFAGVATMLAIINSGGGIAGVFGSVIVASLIGLVIAPFFAQIVRFFPPVVTGVVITTIGLSLVPVASRWITGANPKAPDFADPVGVGIAAFTLLVIMVLSKVGNATISRLSILLAMIVGTLFSVAIGKADFSKVFTGPIFAFPTPFAFGLPTFNIAGIVSMLIVVLVILTETTADILAVAEITGSKVDRKRIAAGLRADMLSSAVSPVFNSFTQSAFAQNVGLVAVTKIKSRYAVAAGGVVLIVLGLFPVLGRIVAAVPTAVLGGAGLVLFGTVTASGIRTLAKVKYEGNMNLIIVAASISFGVLPEVNSSVYSHFPTWFQVIFNSGISSAAIMAIVLNLVFNHFTKGTPENPSVFAASPVRVVKTDVIRVLREGDRYEGGKLVNADGETVLVEDEEPAHGSGH
ncbi:nucleobase:cation symporter-2 family protein [Microbacterium capsulatum]|uniref:Nucleobase:cation symporter-2 family protein n=1 Tax=Microbacterium capsulatum TaxID=3041921 RepID=A0ABU0XED9_9MICO|nr:nucleobase:cation symporter-2 family protein [Microbacterium sp. ASV81]MDQ4213479.1 nucleobase:cation symporter-2 family protein [Microbacterium sp. ASV81]